MAQAHTHPLATPGPLQRTVAAVVQTPLAWAVFVGVMFALPLTKAVTRQLPEPPPVLGQIPAFTLTNERGETIRTADLHGKVWIAEFMTTAQAAATGRADTLLTLQHRLRNMGDLARLLSISVDPATDTPEHLAAYASTHNANPYLWHFLTGETAALHAAVRDLVRAGQPDLPPDALHVDAGYLLLIDPDARLRGCYPATESGVDELLMDLGLVANFYRPAPPEGAHTREGREV